MKGFSLVLRLKGLGRQGEDRGWLLRCSFSGGFGLEDAWLKQYADEGCSAQIVPEGEGNCAAWNDHVFIEVVVFVYCIYTVQRMDSFI